MILNILISIGFSIILMLISSNLLGFFVRGLFPIKEMEQMNLKLDLYDDYKSKTKYINFLSLLLIIGYLYVLYHFWNIGISIIGVIFMLIRLPDLIWEIKNGKLITKNASKKMNKNILYLIGSIFPLISPFIIYYLLYKQ